MSRVLIEGTKSLGFDITEEQLHQFDTYRSLLQEWNDRMNLTAITEDEAIERRHFLDSLSLYDGSFFEGKRVIDIGTGAGFPALPIKIMTPDMEITLLDSLRKRIDFLDTVIEALGLKACVAIHERAEILARTSEHREAYDTAMARAVAPLNVLVEYALPFLKIGGYFLALKSQQTDDEISEAKNAIAQLGGKLMAVQERPVPDTDMVNRLILIQKIKATPKSYPRKAGKPSKQPIR